MRLELRITTLMIVGLLAVASAAYTAGYVYLVEQEVRMAGSFGCCYFKFVPRYRYANEIAQPLFWPAHQIDLTLRRDYWELVP